MTRILVVDDEPQIRRAMQTGLTAHGYEVVVAEDGERALAAVVDTAPDLVFLDLGLPDIDGAEVIRRLRSFSSIPVIVVSVRDAQADKVEALDAGADDYVTKPFAMEELLARARAALRRSGDPSSVGDAVLRFGGLTIDLTKQLVDRDEQRVHLTPTEYSLLEAMVTQPGKLLTHLWLLRRVWGPAYGEESHYLRVYVRQLRQKLGDDAADPHLILTEPAIGYRWIGEPD